MKNKKLRTAVATTAAAPTAPAAGEFRRVALGLIDPSPFQARKTFEQSPDWPEFVASVRTSGVVQAGVGREKPDGRIELVCGERRFRASQEVGLADLPLVIRPLTDAAAQEIVAIENLQREGLNEIEEAQGYADWIKRLTTPPTPGPDTSIHTPAQCATRKEAIEYIETRIHRKRAQIYERLRLVELTKEEAALVTSGKISASVASLLPTIPDPKARAKLLKEWDDRWRYDDDFRPSVRAVEEQIEDEFCKPLREVKFDLEKEYPLPEDMRGHKSADAVLDLSSETVVQLVSCVKCPWRSGNRLDEFPALAKRPNVCTRPGCAKVKTALAAQEKVAAAAEKGKAVLTLKEFRARKDEFVDGNKSCPAQNRWGDNWENCMGQHAPKPVLVPTADGVLKVYPKAEAEAAAKKNGVKLATASKPQSEADRQKAEREREAIEARRQKLIETHAPTLWKNFLKQKIEEIHKFLLERWGHSADEGPFKGKTTLEKLIASQLNDEDAIDYRGDWNERGVKFWKRYGVDLIAEETKVLQAEQAKAKAPDRFVQEILSLARAAGFKPLAAQFKAIADMAQRAGLKDIDQCKTEADRHELMAQFKTDYPACLKGKSKSTKSAPAAKQKGKKK